MSTGISRWLKEPMYRNSTVLIASQFFSAAAGFVFWVVAARLYSADDLGLSAVLISSLALPIIVSRVGLDQAIVRFSPEGNKEGILGTALWTTTLLCVAFGLVFLAVAPLVSSRLTVLSDHWTYYMAFLLSNSVVLLLGLFLVSMRSTGHYLAVNVLMYSRIPLLFIFIPLGTLGIFVSVGISCAIAAGYAFIAIRSIGVRQLWFDLGFLREARHFSASSYVFGISVAAPAYVIPLIVMQMLGPQATAQYYMAYTISSFLFMLPNAVVLSLYVEGSHGRSFNLLVRKASKYIAFLVVTGIAALFVFGHSVLGMIGAEYDDAFNLLMLMALSSVPMSACNLYFTMNQIRKTVDVIVPFGVGIFLMTILLSMALIPVLGLTAIGWSWLLTYALIAVLSALAAKYSRFSIEAQNA